MSISVIRWNPDAIVFNSYQAYGTPSYWVQLFFSESSGATLLSTSLQGNSSNSIVASAIAFQNSADKQNYIRIKVTNNFASVTHLFTYFKIENWFCFLVIVNGIKLDLQKYYFIFNFFSILISLFIPYFLEVDYLTLLWNVLGFKNISKIKVYDKPLCVFGFT